MNRIQYRNIDTKAPGYKGEGGTGLTSMGSSGGGDAYDPYIYILAGESIEAGQVLQVRTVEENNEPIRKVFVQKAHRTDHNKTIGIAVEDAETDETCKIAGNGLEFDYSVILANKELSAFDGVQLFCVNSDFNVATVPNEKDNHLIIIGDLTSATSVFININEYQNLDFQD
jgi:hypothetical protein